MNKVRIFTIWMNVIRRKSELSNAKLLPWWSKLSGADFSCEAKCGRIRSIASVCVNELAEGIARMQQWIPISNTIEERNSRASDILFSF